MGGNKKDSEVGKKSTEAEILRRVSLCVDMLNDGWSPRQIFQFITKNADAKKNNPSEYRAEFDWNVTERMVYHYAEKAYEIIAGEYVPKIKASFNQSLMRWNKLFQKALQEKNMAEARMCLQRIDKLMKHEDFKEGGESGADDDDYYVLPGGIKSKL